jgi:hypothetical protein
VGTGFPQKMRQNQKARSLSDSIEAESDLGDNSLSVIIRASGRSSNHGIGDNIEGLVIAGCPPARA